MLAGSALSVPASSDSQRRSVLDHYVPFFEKVYGPRASHSTRPHVVRLHSSSSSSTSSSTVAAAAHHQPPSTQHVAAIKQILIPKFNEIINQQTDVIKQPSTPARISRLPSRAQITLDDDDDGDDQCVPCDNDTHIPSPTRVMNFNVDFDWQRNDPVSQRLKQEQADEEIDQINIPRRTSKHDAHSSSEMKRDATASLADAVADIHASAVSLLSGPGVSPSHSRVPPPFPPRKHSMYNTTTYSTHTHASLVQQQQPSPPSPPPPPPPLSDDDDVVPPSLLSPTQLYSPSSSVSPPHAVHVHTSAAARARNSSVGNRTQVNIHMRAERSPSPPPPPPPPPPPTSHITPNTLAAPASASHLSSNTLAVPASASHLSATTLAIDETLKEGLLRKKSPRMVKGYQIRHFTLYADRIEYRKPEKQTLQGTIFLSTIQQVTHSEPKKPKFIITVTGEEGMRDFILKAKDGRGADAWRDAIATAIQQLTRMRPVSTHHNREQSLNEDFQAFRASQLQMSAQVISRFNPRTVSLSRHFFQHARNDVHIAAILKNCELSPSLQLPHGEQHTQPDYFHVHRDKPFSLNVFDRLDTIELLKYIASIDTLESAFMKDTLSFTVYLLLFQAILYHHPLDAEDHQVVQTHHIWVKKFLSLLKDENSYHQSFDDRLKLYSVISSLIASTRLTTLMESDKELLKYISNHYNACVLNCSDKFSLMFGVECQYHLEVMRRFHELNKIAPSTNVNPKVEKLTAAFQVVLNIVKLVGCCDVSAGAQLLGQGLGTLIDVVSSKIKKTIAATLYSLSVFENIVLTTHSDIEVIDADACASKHGYSVSNLQKDPVFQLHRDNLYKQYEEMIIEVHCIWWQTLCANFSGLKGWAILCACLNLLLSIGLSVNDERLQRFVVDFAFDNMKLQSTFKINMTKIIYLDEQLRQNIQYKLVEILLRLRDSSNTVECLTNYIHDFLVNIQFSSDSDTLYTYSRPFINTSFDTHSLPTHPLFNHRFFRLLPRLIHLLIVQHPSLPHRMHKLTDIHMMATSIKEYIIFSKDHQLLEDLLVFLSTNHSLLHIDCTPGEKVDIHLDQLILNKALNPYFGLIGLYIKYHFYNVNYGAHPPEPRPMPHSKPTLRKQDSVEMYQRETI